MQLHLPFIPVLAFRVWPWLASSASFASFPCVFTRFCFMQLHLRSITHFVLHPAAAVEQSSSWQLLAAPGSSCQLLAAPGIACQHLPLPGNMRIFRNSSWRFMAAPNSSWQLLAAPGQLLADAGSSCQHLLPHGNMWIFRSSSWQLLPAPWYLLAALGSSWQAPGSF